VSDIVDIVSAFRIVSTQSDQAQTDANLVHAKALHLERGAALWDALILAACVEAGVETFYSEDLPGFDDFEGLQIVNPFK